MQQEARARLRKDFLLSQESLIGQECRIQLREGKEMTAVFRGIKSDGSLFLVSDLMTPVGKHDHAIIRSSDIMFIRGMDQQVMQSK
jgi:molybdopterin-binding protein